MRDTPPPMAPRVTDIPLTPPVVVALPVRSASPPLLLRIAITDPRWAESIPPVPTGLRVTVAFSDPDVEAEHADAVALLGYAVVGSVDVEPIDAPSADFLIPRVACDRWPLWRDQILGTGGRVWDLAFGPAAVVLGHALSVHRVGIV